MDCAPSVVLMTRSIEPAWRASTICGEPSRTLFTISTDSPCCRRNAAVPRVATTEKPFSANCLAIGRVAGLSRSRTLKKTLPVSGKIFPAANCALTKAMAKDWSIPMTSPVDFISRSQ